MIKKMLIIIFLLIANLFLLNVNSVNAAIRYPISSLANCRNARECRLFCDIPKNTPACWAFSQYSLVSDVLGVTTISDDSSVQKNKISFPIAQLGNCTNIGSCRDYCRLDENKAICTDFALKKKLQKTRVREIANEVLLKARTELGCDSKTSCHNYCRKPENEQICQSFGEKNLLIKKAAVENLSLNPQIMEKTASELGCSSELACKNLCNHPDNKKRCQAFAAKYSLGTLSGKQKSNIAKELIGSGLCKNEVECASYCQKNPSQCPGFNEISKTSSGSADSASYLGPGGCKSIKECFLYCKNHPDACPAFPKKSASFENLTTNVPEKVSPTKLPEDEYEEINKDSESENNESEEENEEIKDITPTPEIAE